MTCHEKWEYKPSTDPVKKKVKGGALHREVELNSEVYSRQSVLDPACCLLPPLYPIAPSLRS
jgi:hypothetical protein